MAAPVVFFAFIALGALIPYFPAGWPCLRFTTSLLIALVACAVAASAAKSAVTRLIAGAVAAAISGIVTIGSYHFSSNSQLLTFPDALLIVVLSSIPSFAPVYHVMRVQEKIRCKPRRSFARIVAQGTVIGATQGAFISLFVVPLLWLILPALPPDIENGSSESGRLICIATIGMGVFLAGAMAGAFAAIYAE